MTTDKEDDGEVEIEVEIEEELTEEDVLPEESGEATEPDWLTTIQEQQAQIAEAIANDKLIPLAAALNGLVVGKPDPTIDQSIAQVQLQKDLQSAARHAFEGYTLWLASGMARQNRFEPFRVRIPGEGIMQRIADEVDVPMPILRFVIACANEEPHLPIVGDIVGGTLVPDVLSIKRWANYFDWSE